MQKCFECHPNLSDEDRMHKLISKVDQREPSLDWVFDYTPSNETYQTVVDRLMEDYNSPRILIVQELRKLMDTPAQQGRGSLADHLSKMVELIEHVKSNVEGIVTEQLFKDVTASERESQVFKKKNEGVIGKAANDALFAGLLYLQCDATTRTQLNQAKGLKASEMPTFQQLKEFVRTRSNDLKAGASGKPKNEKNDKVRAHVTSSSSESSRKCPMCEKDNHSLSQCSGFKKLPLKDRWDTVQKKFKVCQNCLDKKKDTCACFKGNKDEQKGKCKRCEFMHHDMLHRDKKKEPQKIAVANTTSVAGGDSGQAVLGTVVLLIKSGNGKWVPLKAMIDPAATDSFISEKAMRLLELPRQSCETKVLGIGSNQGPKVKGVAQMLAKGTTKQQFQMEFQTLVVDKITNNSPSRCIALSKQELKEPSALGDPGFRSPGVVDLLLSTRLFPQFSKEKPCNIRVNKSLMWYDTKLGYVLMGEEPTSRCLAVTTEEVVEEEPDDLLGKLFEGMSKFFAYDKDEFRRDEELCEEFYKSTTLRLPNGGYSVKIPFKVGMDLGESAHRSRARYIQMEKRLESKPKVKKHFHAYIEDQLAAGHVKLADPDVPAKCVLPIQLVINENSLSTPVRPTLDASMKTSNNRSLNDVQMKGPALQSHLGSQIIRGRKGRISVRADMSQMFLHINVQEDDIDYHRFFYRKCAEEPLKQFVCTKVPFGTASASFLAIRTVQQLAEDEKERFPIASKILLTNFYVDDLTTSFDCEDEAREAIRQLRGIMAAGGFVLKKWSSNVPSVLREVPKEDLLSDLEAQMLGIEEGESKEKILGIRYSSREDDFFYEVKQGPVEVATRRSATSAAAKMFDPPGFLSPVMIVGRMIIQKMWRLGKAEKDWDTPLPEDLNREWIKWQTNLPSVKDMRFPRWLEWEKGMTGCLVVFCDASDQAYGAVVYLRTVRADGSVNVRWVSSKARVVPLDGKKITPVGKGVELTMPRLELMAMVVGAEMVVEAREALEFPKDFEVRAFTDNVAALLWVRKDPACLKTFEGNRVQKINAAFPSSKWDHVDTEKNPADVLSRGIETDQLKNCELYWKAPQFIRDPEYWVKPFPARSFNDSNFQVKNVVAQALMVETKTSLFDYCSDFRKKVRVVAWCKRVFAIKKGFKAKLDLAVGHALTVEEFDEAERFLIREEQYKAYGYELNCLDKGLPIKKGTLQNLNIKKDSHGILRVDGRMGHALLSDSEKNPMILPKLDVPKEKTGAEEMLNVQTTVQIIRAHHQRVLHGGTMKTLASIRQRFFIPGGKNAVKFVLRRCVKCKTEKPEMYEQLMGNVPVECITASPPFYHTAVDYAGPFTLKSSAISRCKHYKAWIAVYVCMSTGACHIDTVSGLDARSFLSSFQKFVARRGLPHTMRSDNAGAFIKGKKLTELDAHEYSLAMKGAKEGSRQLLEFAAENKVIWKFAPARSPHHNGKVESTIKIVKQYLRKVIGGTKLTYENLDVVLCRIEAQLNSRPLCVSPGEEGIVLTPGHFLVMRAMNQLPEPDCTDMNPTRRWQWMQKLAQQFWKLMYRDHFYRMRRDKWLLKEPNIKVGDVVLIHDDNARSMYWPKARVTEVHPGSDGLVRVATVQDANKRKFTRSVTKLAKLPISSEDCQPAEKSDNEDQVLKKKQKKSKIQGAKKKQDAAPKMVRRSPRLAVKKLGWSYYALASLTFCCLGFDIANGSLTTQASAASVENKVVVHPFNDSGVVFVHLRDLLVQSGTMHVKINTNLNKTREIGRINTQMEKYAEACELVAGSAKRYCVDNLSHLTAWADKIKGEIESYGGTMHKQRSKRFDGIFSWLWSGLNVLLFGSSKESNLEGLSARKTAGMVEHELEAFQQVGRQLEERQDRIHKETGVLRQIMEDENKRWVGDYDDSRIAIQMLQFEAQLKENIQAISDSYRNIKETSFGKEEVERIQASLKETMPENSDFPNADFVKILQATKAEVVAINELIHLELEIPIVFKQRVQEFFTAPIPNHGQIIKDPPGFLVVDRENKLFKKADARLKVKEVIKDVFVLTESVEWWDGKKWFDCTANKFLQSFDDSGCEIDKLPAEFDEWIQIPVPNLVLFYTTKLPSAKITCPKGGESLQVSMGLLEIPVGCWVQTSKKRFYAQNDLHASGSKFFLVGHELLQIAINKTSSVTDPIEFKDLTAYDDGKLLESIIETKDVLDGEVWQGWKWVAMAALSVVVLAFVVAIGIGCYLKTKTQRKAVKEELALERLQNMPEVPAAKEEDP